LQSKKIFFNKLFLVLKRRQLLFVPQEIFFTKGVGKEKEQLASFEMALRDAQIAKYNIVRVSSIFPPGCKMISREQGLKKLLAGQIIYVVIGEAATNEPNRLIGASIGVAIPKDPQQHGYLSEYHAYGKTQQKVGDYAEDLAAYMLATTLGLSFDADVVYDSRREFWKMKKEVVRTRNITQTALGDKTGLWTTAIAAAVLLP